MGSRDALELAIALHAAPRLVPRLRQESLPEAGVSDLLRVALGQEEALAGAVRRSGADPAIVSEAARFFIEQVLLVPASESDPWRVLGLTPGAPEAKLREHYRLLVSLLHPDRSNDWPCSFADRVNKAWRALRRADDRERFLDTRRPPAALAPTVDPSPRVPPGRFAASPHAPAAPTVRQTVREGGRYRNLPAWIAVGICMVSGFALVADRWVAQRYGGLYRAEPPSAQHPTFARPLPTADRIAAGDLVPARETSLRFGPVPPLAPEFAAAEGVRLGHSAVSPRGQNDRSQATTPARTEPRRRAVPARHVATLASHAGPVVQAPILDAPPGAASGSVRRRRGTGARSLASDAVGESIPPGVAEAPGRAKAQTTLAAFPELEPEASPAWSEDKVRELLQRYRERYGRGDLVGILNLFSLDAHAGDGGMPGLAESYGRLFASAHSRELDINGLYWRLEDGRVLGGGRYSETIRGGRAGMRRVASGRIEFVLTSQGEEARFERLARIQEPGS